ncbi:Arylsulfatase [Fusarium oxysporum f. sp. albedinis]|nr:Arylsulfatase [Fusarium oxysporum f. sp. albedinis]
MWITRAERFFHVHSCRLNFACRDYQGQTGLSRARNLGYGVTKASAPVQQGGMGPITSQMAMFEWSRSSIAPPCGTIPASSMLRLDC